MLSNNTDSMQSRSMLKTFISKFVSGDLLTNIINLSLYPADFPYSSHMNVVEYIKEFLNNVNKTAYKLNYSNYKQIRAGIDTTISILTIRDSGTIINYDNVFQHVNVSDLYVKKTIQTAIQNQIKDINEFKYSTNEVLNTIQAFYEVKSIQSNILKYDTLIDSMNASDMPIFEFLKRYKDTVIDSFNELSKLKTLTKEENRLSNYIILNNKDSSRTLANTLVQYFGENYTHYKTGFHLMDQYIGGLESSSVHIVSAASNHGKSLLLINLCQNIIQNNIEEFDEKDAILFITLEDDIYKLSRRFISIFGNYVNNTIKDLYKQSYLMCKEHNNEPSIVNKITLMLDNVLQSSIISKTAKKVNLIIYHGEENTFSPNDLSKFIDSQKAEGYNIKSVFLDYIDVMSPTVNTGYKNESEYHAHGQIVHELRTMARRYSMPILTATQNTRVSENVTKELTNDLMGDSYKKVRYSDYIYMMRMFFEKTFMDQDVREFVMPKKNSNSSNNQISPEYLKVQNDLKDVLVPVQIVITKSKDDGKGAKRYCLFCKQNLKIYDTIDQYLEDAPSIKKNTKILEQDMDKLFNSATNVYEIDDVFTDENDKSIFNESDIFNVVSQNEMNYDDQEVHELV